MNKKENTKSKLCMTDIFYFIQENIFVVLHSIISVLHVMTYILRMTYRDMEQVGYRQEGF